MRRCVLGPLMLHRKLLPTWGSHTCVLPRAPAPSGKACVTRLPPRAASLILCLRSGLSFEVNDSGIGHFHGA